MPTMANVTVKKADGTTDVVYTGTAGASGDSPAVWYAPALGATQATRPEIRQISRSVPGKPAVKKIVTTGMMPYSVINSTTGVTTVEKRLLFRFEASPDMDVPATLLSEFAAQFANFLASTLHKAAVVEGNAAT